MERTPPEEKGEEVIAIAPEEIQAHLQRGKAHFEVGRYTEALKEFEAILTTAPGNIKTRVWIRKTEKALAEPRIDAVTEQARLLARLQQALKSPTKTEVLLRGLDLMAQLYPSKPIPALGILSEDDEVPLQVATSLEIARLGRYSMAVEQTKNKTREVIRQVLQELSKTDEIVSKYEGDKSALIQTLLELQRENRWLSQDALKWVSNKLDVPLNQIYQVATFYKAFSLLPRGRHSVSVCLGTACHVRGAARLLDKVIETLKIKSDETSRDMRFSLDTVNCLGCCALGPVMVVDGRYYGNPSLGEIEQVAAACE